MPLATHESAADTIFDRLGKERYIYFYFRKIAYAEFISYTCLLPADFLDNTYFGGPNASLMRAHAVMGNEPKYFE